MEARGNVHRLVAILAADVVEYSRLMHEDEEATIAAWQSARHDIIDPVIAAYDGRIVKHTGDGFLVEFATVMPSVKCAVELQDQLSQSSLKFRIGINLGDIVADEDDIHGDGVNIAARIEGVAPPGGICISGAVYDQVHNKIKLGYEDLGEQMVKNIDSPIRIYQVMTEGTAVSSVVKTAKTNRRRSFIAAAAGIVILALGAGLWTTQPWNKAGQPEKTLAVKSVKPSIAILPFNNMSNDKEQEYFSDGMTEDLITDLAKVSGLYVIARNSTFAYKGQSKDIRSIAKELNARYVVEGSVRKIGGRVRINAQLIDAESGNHLWAERYDRDFKDVFKLQDEVLGKIVEALKVTLTKKEHIRIARHETDNPEAYDFYLRGLKQESFFNKASNLKSRQLYERAVQLDPNYAIAYTHLAQAYSLARENRWTDKPKEFADKAYTLAKKAVELDDELPQAHWALGRIASRAPLNDMDLALASLQRVIELDPNYGDGQAFYANILSYVGRSEEAIIGIKKAMQINPQYPFWYAYILGQAQYMLTQYEVAIKNFQIATERNPTVAWPHRFLLASYGQLGKMDDAEWEISELEALGQPPTIKGARERSPFRDRTYLKRYLDGLRKAGVPEE